MNIIWARRIAVADGPGHHKKDANIHAQLITVSSIHISHSTLRNPIYDGILHHVSMASS